MMYYWKEQGFLLEIKPYNGQWGLFINGKLVENHNNPVAMASNCYCHVTGHTNWDVSQKYCPDHPREWQALPR